MDATAFAAWQVPDAMTAQEHAFDAREFEARVERTDRRGD
jgi:hypothetical protein